MGHSADNDALMQVDHHENPSTSTIPSPNPQLKPSRFRISDEAIQDVCFVLRRKILEDGDDDHILRTLYLSIWLFVHEALSEDLELIGRLADRDQFKANVQRKGEQEFINLLRHMKATDSFKDLLENGA